MNFDIRTGVAVARARVPWMPWGYSTGLPFIGVHASIDPVLEVRTSRWHAQVLRKGKVRVQCLFQLP